MRERHSVPRVVAVIPARGGSKGLPGKNIASVGGVPLVARAVHACIGAPSVTDVIVSTDDPAIATAGRLAGARIVQRPADIAGDQATSEDAVLHALDAVTTDSEPATIVLLVQCTSPFVTTDDVEGVTRAVLGGADSALTVAPTHGFLWRDTDAGGTGVNHDKTHRPRRQDREQEYLETGAAYAMSVDGFRTHGHRFFGRTELVLTDPLRVLEVDDAADLAEARALAPLVDEGVRPTRADVDALVFDFDGTMTDDTAHVDAEGNEQVRVHRGDGLGIAALRRAGIPMLVLSTERNPVVAARAAKLGLPVMHGIDDKASALTRWCADHDYDPARVLYAGNDVNDLPCLRLVGWPVAVASAHDVVRRAARVVTVAPGGGGAIRDIATWLLGEELHS